MVEFNDHFAAYNYMKFFNLSMFNRFDPLIEGQMAHEIQNNELRQQVGCRYNELYRPESTPHTHPENYDPLDPPAGWAYDPYYEIWITTIK